MCSSSISYMLTAVYLWMYLQKQVLVAYQIYSSKTKHITIAMYTTMLNSPIDFMKAL